MPEAAPTADHLRVNAKSTAVQPRQPAAPAYRVLLMFMIDLRLSAEFEAPLKQHQPNQRNAVPSAIKKELCGR